MMWDGNEEEQGIIQRTGDLGHPGTLYVYICTTTSYRHYCNTVEGVEGVEEWESRGKVGD